MGVRKNIRGLTDMEKQRFVAALVQLKRSGAYDNYVMVHMNAMHHAHSGPAFLPWHRELLRRLERDLQGIDPTVTLPYWDWTTDNSPSSLPWQPELMGGNGRSSDEQVTEGPFALSGGNWPLMVDSPPEFLRRALGRDAASLPSAADVAAVMSVTPYDSAPWDTTPVNSFRNQLEGWVGPNIHNRVHMWVGGSMEPMSSPNDPVFFLHHCNIDRLWAAWQASHPTEGYQPVSGGPMGHNLNDPMEPWGAPTTVASVLDHHALGYIYDTEVFIPPPPPGWKKMHDDGISVKKIVDDMHRKLPVSDLPKGIQDVKMTGFDAPEDPLARVTQPAEVGQLPFALATPHHSMAWASGLTAQQQALIAAAQVQAQSRG